MWDETEENEQRVGLAAQLVAVTGHQLEVALERRLHVQPVARGEPAVGVAGDRPRRRAHPIHGVDVASVVHDVATRAPLRHRASLLAADAPFFAPLEAVVVDGADRPQPRGILDEVRRRTRRDLPDEDVRLVLRDGTVQPIADLAEVATRPAHDEAPVVADDRRERRLDLRREPHLAADAVAARVTVAEEENCARHTMRDAGPRLPNPTTPSATSGVRRSKSC